MAARRKQALQEKDIENILNGSEIEDTEDDEDLTYQEQALGKLIDRYAKENFSTSEDENSSSSGDEISIPSTSDIQHITRSIRNRSFARTRGGVLCTKKWTVRFISHFIDLSVVNAWIKYKADQKLRGVRSNKILQLRAFKQSIAEKILDDYLLSENEIESITAESSEVLEKANYHKKRGRPPVKPIPSAAFRQRGSLHLPALGTSQHRCRQKNCMMKTTVYCQACDLPLCFTVKRNCFADFHLIGSA